MKHQEKFNFNYYQIITNMENKRSQRQKYREFKEWSQDLTNNFGGQNTRYREPQTDNNNNQGTKTAEKTIHKETTMTDYMVSPNINLKYLKEFNPDTPSVVGLNHLSSSNMASKKKDFADKIQDQQQPIEDQQKPLDPSQIQQAQLALTNLKDHISSMWVGENKKTHIHQEMQNIREQMENIQMRLSQTNQNSLKISRQPVGVELKRSSLRAQSNKSHSRRASQQSHKSMGRDNNTKSLPKPGEDKSWSVKPLINLREAMRKEQQQNNRTLVQQSFQPKKSLSFQNSSVASRASRDDRINSPIKEVDLSASRQQINLDPNDHPYQPNIPSQPNVYSPKEHERSPPLNPLISQVQVEPPQKTDIKLSESPFMHSLQQSLPKDPLQDLKDLSELNDISQNENENARFVLKQVQNEQLDSTDKKKIVQKPNGNNNPMTEEQILYFEAEEMILKQMQIRQQNKIQVEAPKKEEKNNTKKDHEKMSNWTSMESDGFSEKLESIKNQSSNSGNLAEGQKMKIPEQNKVMVESQDDGQPPAGDQAGNSNFDDSFSSSDMTQKDPKQNLTATMSSVKKNQNPQKSQMSKLEIIGNVMSMEHINDSKELLASKITHQTRNSIQFKRQYSEPNLEKHNNLDLDLSNELFNKAHRELPEPAKIQERIQDLLIHYRLDGNRKSDLVSIAPQVNKDEQTSHLATDRVTNFLRRQETLQSNKNKKIEQAQAQYMQKTQRQLLQKPDISKSKKSHSQQLQQLFLNVHTGKKRNVNQFVQDMETQRVMKERRQQERLEKKQKDIRQLAKTKYVSKGSRIILQKAGVDLSQPRQQQNLQTKTDESESSSFSSLGDLGEELKTNLIPAQSMSIQIPHQQLISPIGNNRALNNPQENFGGMMSSSSQQLLSYYKLHNLKNDPKTLQKLNQSNEDHSTMYKSQPILIQSHASVMNSPQMTQKLSSTKFQTTDLQKSKKKTNKKCLESASSSNNHLSSIIQNPFTHFMEGTHASKKYLEARKAKHNEIQKKLSNSKPRYMRLGQQSPYAKKVEEQLKQQLLLQTSAEKNKSTKKELEDKINKFLSRQDKDIELKTKIKQDLSEELLRPVKVEILEPIEEPKKILDKSNRMLFEKFKKEYHSILSKALGSNQLPMAINSFEFTQLLTQFGCATTTEMMNDESKVFKTCEELWTCLTITGQNTLPDHYQKEFVSVDDTKMYFMALFGIQGHRRMNENPPFSPERSDRMPLGYLNEECQLCLTPNCIDMIKTRFNILIHNRTRFLIDKSKEKRARQAKAMYAETTFQPKLVSSEMNEKILREKRIMVQEQNQNNIIKSLSSERMEFKKRSVQNDYQRFIDSKKFWLQYNQQKAENLAIESCTFKPNIQKSSRMVESKMTYSQNYFSLGKNTDLRHIDNQDPTLRQSIASFNNDRVETQSEDKGIEKQTRFEQLYQLTTAKLRKRKLISSITREEQEFAKQKEECTFKPTLLKSSFKHLKSTSDLQKAFVPPKHQSPIKQIFNQPKKKTEDHGDKEQIKQKIEVIRQKSNEVHVEREKHAQMLRKYKLDCNERYNVIQKPPPVFKQKEVMKKIEKTFIDNLMIRSSQRTVSPNSMVEKPFLYIDIDIGEGDKDRITVFRNDSPTNLSKDFCKKHNFDNVTHGQLISLIQERIAKVKEMQATSPVDAVAAKEKLSPINEIVVEEIEDTPPMGNQNYQKQEQEAGERLMTNNSSIFQQFGNAPESRSYTSNPMNLVEDRPLTMSHAQPVEGMQSPHAEMDMSKGSKGRERISAVKSIDRIKNFKNMLLGEYNPLTEDETSQNQNINTRHQ